MDYTEKVIDHFKNPRNVGELKDANAIGRVGSPSCGDKMEMYLKIEDGIIKDAKFMTFGCAAAISSSSVATELLKGMTIEEAKKLTNQQVVEKLGGLPEAKIHCSVMVEEAVKAALEDYYKRK
ncbi:MAG: iron-sulfur cluster assembly scaffold protein [Eubacteriaceae bacterium]|nr:iron-sulfur cluster assembly scaffold protein [Eubacteriaceae bacterium]